MARRMYEAALRPVKADRDPRWMAVLDRAPVAGEQFVYAVRTTGVYCRPGSASRLPRPENVEFFDSAQAAEAAGYRASRRAHADRDTIAQRHRAVVVQACRQIAAAQRPPRLEALARKAGLSAWHFHRIFKSLTGLTPRSYALAHRARAVRDTLGASASVTDAIYAAGYPASSRFYEKSNAVLGMTPTRFRSGGAGTDIHFAVGRCSLGSVLVAESESGICAISLGDDPHALVLDLQDRFARANLIGADVRFEARIARIVGFLDAPATGLDLPLDVRGTAFQMRVWQALCALPPGTTASYAQIAARIGAPRAARAVAAACAANPLAVVIPCHRVVRSDGSLSGYRWGVERKRELLRRETAGAPTVPVALVV